MITITTQDKHNRVWSVCVTDRHFQNFQLWMPVKISDQMWWIDLWFIVKGITKCHSIKFAMVTYLNENQWNVQCHRVGDRYFALTSRYSIAIYILTIFCAVLLIVNVSQINRLSCQIFGISKQALDFVRDGKFCIPDEKFEEKKNAIFWQHPFLKTVWSKKFYTLEIFEEPNS